MSKTYVHEAAEVVLTGRVAQKTLRSGKIDEVVEIKPANAENGSWKKWVKMSELFEIIT